MAETVSGVSFVPADLRIAERKPGISAFMRIRNGADFLEQAIRSHISHFDEIVAVYNQCTDATPEILARLEQEFGPKLRVTHYTDRVYPPGSEGHKTTDPASPNSLVNYYNFALAATQFRIATKLDDDHLAVGDAVAALCAKLRSGALSPREMHCFSGVNLIRDDAGRLGVPAHDMLAGTGDHGFFVVGPDTYFKHDRRFERFQHGSLRRVFSGFLYWHLKYLKQGFGFINYELEANPDSRYGKKRRELDRTSVLAEDEVRRRLARAAPMLALGSVFSEKNCIRFGQAREISRNGLPELFEAVERRLRPAEEQVGGS